MLKLDINSSVPGRLAVIIVGGFVENAALFNRSLPTLITLGAVELYKEISGFNVPSSTSYLSR